MPLLDYQVFEEALTLFHHYSLQNSETVRQLQLHGLLPEKKQAGFAILDIGAGQGYLPSLMAPFADKLVLLEPNRRCVELLQERFETVIPLPWDALACKMIRQDHPDGFDLITMSHMLYHFAGLTDIEEKIRLAYSLLKPNGRLAIVLNTPAAPMARIGIGYQMATGRMEEALVNQEIHSTCHHPEFYRSIVGDSGAVAIYPIDTPLYNVPTQEDLVKLFRMCLLHPLSQAPCDTGRLDAFIADYLKQSYPDLAYPITLPSQDELIVLQKAQSRSLSQAG